MATKSLNRPFGVKGSTQSLHRVFRSLHRVYTEQYRVYTADAGSRESTADNSGKKLEYVNFS